jgi:hypothetical protein
MHSLNRPGWAWSILRPADCLELEQTDTREWPGSIIEQLKIIGPLTEPTRSWLLRALIDEALALLRNSQQTPKPDVLSEPLL